MLCPKSRALSSFFILFPYFSHENCHVGVSPILPEDLPPCRLLETSVAAVAKDVPIWMRIPRSMSIITIGYIYIYIIYIHVLSVDVYIS